MSVNPYFAAVAHNDVDAFRALLADKRTWPLIPKTENDVSLLETIALSSTPMVFMKELWRMVLRFPKTINYCEWQWERLVAQSAVLPNYEVFQWLLDIDHRRNIPIHPLPAEICQRFFGSPKEQSVLQFLESKQKTLHCVLAQNRVRNPPCRCLPAVNIMFADAGDKLSAMWRASSQIDLSNVERCFGVGSGAVLAVLMAFGVDHALIGRLVEQFEAELYVDAPTRKDIAKINQDIVKTLYDRKEPANVVAKCKCLHRVEEVLGDLSNVKHKAPTTFKQLRKAVRRDNRFRHLHVIFYSEMGTMVDISSEDAKCGDISILEAIRAAVVPRLQLARVIQHSPNVYVKPCGTFDPSAVLHAGYLNMGGDLPRPDGSLLSFNYVQPCPRTLVVQVLHASPEKVRDAHGLCGPLALLKAFYCSQELYYARGRETWQTLTIWHELSAKDMFGDRSDAAQAALMKSADDAVKAFEAM